MDDTQKAFRDFEHAGWQEVAGDYADLAGAATSQAAEPLLDAVGAGPGNRVLDVATGPGFVAAAAAARGAEAVGVDLSEEMVKEATERHPDLDFRVGSAEELPFADATFDAVVSAFGMPHFAHPEAFFAESQRVLRGGGRLGFATWKPPDRNPLFGLITGAVVRAGKLDAAAAPPGPDMMAYGDPDRCRPALEEAGFLDVEIGECTVLFAVPDATGLLETITRGTVRTRALILGQSPDARRRIVELLADDLESYRDGSGFSVPGTVLIAAARRPG